MLSSHPVAYRRKSSLEMELQDIHDNRARRKSCMVSATQIPFLEMDLHGLCATRSFSNRKMLSYLLDMISMFDDAAETVTEPKNNLDKAKLSFSPSDIKLRYQI